MEIYPAALQMHAFTSETFSARRTPDAMHFRMARCASCGLLRSDPIADAKDLAALYQKSSFDYQSEVQSIQQTYGRYLRKLESYGISRHALLEVGCGNGFFLEEALKQGFRDVRGVEPSSHARAQAPAHLRDRIVEDVFRPGVFSEASFDVVCFFQVLDHLSDPAQSLREAFRVLRPGGCVLCLNHNVESFSAHVLKEKSPIVDIEHTFLYSPKTLSKLLHACGFTNLQSGTVFNLYSLSYIVRLFPFPSFLKQGLLRLLTGISLGSTRLLMPLGNLFAIGQKKS
ncbi:MAG: class I SAM-dependent methyltransferase [Candidatus Ozemobacteraceae bacterium]